MSLSRCIFSVRHCLIGLFLPRLAAGLSIGTRVLLTTRLPVVTRPHDGRRDLVETVVEDVETGDCLDSFRRTSR